MFEPSFRQKTVKCFKILLMKKNVTFISLIMFYQCNNTVFLECCYLLFIPSLIILFVFIICVFFKISYPNTIVTLKKKFNDFSRMGIPDILMSIMSCRGFSKKNSTFIFTCRSALVPCYLSKGIIIVET